MIKSEQAIYVKAWQVQTLEPQAAFNDKVLYLSRNNTEIPKISPQQIQVHLSKNWQVQSAEAVTIWTLQSWYIALTLLPMV